MPIQHKLKEREANEIITVLKKNGIEATKLKDESGREVLWTIVIPKSEAQKTLRILQENSLPRRKDKGFNEIYGAAGMIPTATEERAKYLMAISGEMARTLKRIDGVLDARVHIVIPKQKILKNPTDKPPPPRASVLLIIRARPRPLLKKRQVKQLVAGSLESLAQKDISVVMIPRVKVSTSGASKDGGDAEGTTAVMMIRVAKADAMKLKIILGLMILGLVVFLGLFVWFFMRSASLKNRLKSLENNNF